MFHGVHRHGKCELRRSKVSSLANLNPEKKAPEERKVEPRSCLVWGPSFHSASLPGSSKLLFVYTMPGPNCVLTLFSAFMAPSALSRNPAYLNIILILQSMPEKMEHTEKRSKWVRVWRFWLCGC